MALVRVVCNILVNQYSRREWIAVADITATFGTNAARWFANKIFLQKILFVHLMSVQKNETRAIYARVSFFLVDGGGFEPPKAELADLQSAPFGHSGTRPYLAKLCCGCIFKT